MPHVTVRRWAGSVFLSNRARGILAEFLVTRALRVEKGVRVEWDAKDLVTGAGTSVEVKSAAYIHTWAQNAPSRIVVDIAPHRGWDAESNRYADGVGRAAEVYVFCLLAEQDQQRVDPLDVGQWRFWLVSGVRLTAELGSQKAAALSTIERIAGSSTAFDDLASAMERARGR